MYIRVFNFFQAYINLISREKKAISPIEQKFPLEEHVPTDAKFIFTSPATCVTSETKLTLALTLTPCTLIWLQRTAVRP